MGELLQLCWELFFCIDVNTFSFSFQMFFFYVFINFVIAIYHIGVSDKLIASRVELPSHPPFSLFCSAVHCLLWPPEGDILQGFTLSCQSDHRMAFPTWARNPNLRPSAGLSICSIFSVLVVTYCL